MNVHAGSSATDWRELTIPDGQPPVLVQRLSVDSTTGGVTTLVRFPAGWRRPFAGHYVVDEEALFLDGSFRMTGLDYPGVTYAFFPAGYERTGSVSADGMLALASFGGRADWRRGSTSADTAAVVRIDDWQRLPVVESKETGVRNARLLREHAAGSTWMLAEGPTGRSPKGALLELFSLQDHAWTRVQPGEAIPPMRAPLYCRLRSSGA